MKRCSMLGTLCLQTVKETLHKYQNSIYLHSSSPHIQFEGFKGLAFLPRLWYTVQKTTEHNQP